MLVLSGQTKSLLKGRESGRKHTNNASANDVRSQQFINLLFPSEFPFRPLVPQISSDTVLFSFWLYTLFTSMSRYSHFDLCQCHRDKVTISTSVDKYLSNSSYIIQMSLPASKRNAQQMFKSILTGKESTETQLHYKSCSKTFCW